MARFDDLTPVDTVPRALQLARRLHAGQVDKQGRDYTTYHLEPITAALAPHGESAQVAGALHDVLEDTDCTAEELLALGVPPDAVDAVASCTKREGEPYLEMVRRAAAHPLGRLVKIADNRHNWSELDALPAPDAERLRRKYSEAYTVLTAGTGERRLSRGGPGTPTLAGCG